MYKASIENKGDSRYFAATRHSGFVLDTEGKGANPIDTLLASLCGCIGHYVREYITDHKITHNGFSVEAETGLTQDNSNLAEINVCIDLKEVNLIDRQVSEMLKNAKSIISCNGFRVRDRTFNHRDGTDGR